MMMLKPVLLNNVQDLLIRAQNAELDHLRHHRGFDVR